MSSDGRESVEIICESFAIYKMFYNAKQSAMIHTYKVLIITTNCYQEFELTIKTKVIWYESTTVLIAKIDKGNILFYARTRLNTQTFMMMIPSRRSLISIFSSLLFFHIHYSFLELPWLSLVRCHCSSSKICVKLFRKTIPKLCPSLCWCSVASSFSSHSLDAVVRYERVSAW